ncbi:MAG: glycosyl transferase [Acidimicrobiales bacterium]|nr:MAG: glycosyl transferase [Acidimicrobiales bacterium]
MSLDGKVPRLVHLTTTDMSLDWLLGPQLAAFAAAGFEVIGVSADGPHVERLRSRWGVEHVALRHSTRARDPISDLRAACEFFSLLRRLRPDLVHTHNPKPGIYGRIVARLAGVPVVVNTQHGLYATSDDPLPKRILVYAVERLAAVFSDMELVQSREDLRTLAALRVPGRKLRWLGNGVDLGRYSPASAEAGARVRVRAEWGVPQQAVVVGSVGRLVREKGWEDFFAAAGRLRDKGEVVFVAVGPREPGKPDALDEHDLEEAERSGVLVVGERHDMVDVYSAFDVFVLASRREGFPRSAMEAAAMALPLVVTDVRGCREVVDDGVNGFLYPPGNVAKLVEILSALVADEAKRQRMGAASRRKALAEFDQRRVITTTLDVYRELLERAARRRPLRARFLRARASSE